MWSQNEANMKLETLAVSVIHDETFRMKLETPVQFHLERDSLD